MVADDQGSERLRQDVSTPLIAHRVLKHTLLALIVAVVAAWVVWDRLAERQRVDLVEVFEFESAEIAFRIEERFRAYHQVLRGAQGLFAASTSVEHDEWHVYVARLRLEEDYPGIQGLGFARWLRPDEIAGHERHVRSETGWEDYRVWPDDDRAEYSAIKMLEPLDWRNQRALGYDMYSEAVRREAMNRAVETGSGALSGKVKLVQETGEDVQSGVLLYLPVFVNHVPVETAEQRRAALFGWVYSPFRMNDLIEGTVARFSEFVRVRIYDEARDEDALLYDSHPQITDPIPPALALSTTVELNGRDWVLWMEARPGYAAGVGGLHAELIAIIAVGLMFVLAVWSFASTRERARALQRAATHDPLTGVPNRLLFADLLDATISRAERYGEHFGLLFIDLDRFKAVNDRHGHEVGDRLLVEAVERIRRCIRGSDTLSRQGGDEFVVLLPKSESREDLQTVAGKILDALTARFLIRGEEMHIGASIGIVRFPEHGRDADGLLRHADAAMYQAKSEGRGRIRFYERGPEGQGPVTIGLDEGGDRNGDQGSAADVPRS